VIIIKYINLILIIVNNNFDIIGWFFERLFRYRNRCNILVFNYLIHFFCYIKGVKIGKKVVFNGFPVIRRYENSDISIGDCCRFNSAKNSIPIGLQRRCTIVTLRKKSEIIIGDNFGGSGITLLAAIKIKIGNNVMIGAHSMIFDTDFHHSDPNKRQDRTDIPARPVIIEDNVFIGTNCTILKGITIGENSVIGANSVVINSMPKNSIAMGNPCKVVIIKNWNLPAT
jgi:carbonic anhydrase/acetyltransferase-like protein (isoleucine patch superfamily)